MMKYIHSPDRKLKVASESWIMEAQMLNSAQDFCTKGWWFVGGKEHESFKEISLKEALEIAIASEKPKHEHDCDECTFVGKFQGDKESFDLYYCKKTYPTVIARFGEGGEYFSGLGLVGYIRSLGEALERVKILGLR